MLRNFLLVTVRNLLKNKLYSGINIAGLSVGIICSILILLWVSDELSFDSFIPKADRLCQVWVHAEFDGTINSWRSVPLPTYEAMKTADVNIINSAVGDWGGDHLLTVDEKRIIKRGYFVSEEFLDMFEFPLVRGDASSVLDDPSSIVITESMATALFGNEDPINKIIRVDDTSELKVTGILKDIPKNSSFQFDYLLTWKHREQINEWVVDNQDNWGNYSFQVFVELNDAASFESAEDAVRDMLTEKGEDDIPREFMLYPLKRWRLYSSFENGKETGGISDYVQLFTIIAIFILVIACINFMNLATARSEHRAKEVGIRKSIGSSRGELMMQFIGESMMITIMAFVIAVLGAQLLLPAYNTLVEKELFIDYSSGRFWLYSAALILFTGFVSGSYPALYLSSFKPVVVLKGKVKVGKSASTPRKVLVMLQFGVSTVLIIGTLVIIKQIELVKGRELGYEQANLITVKNTDEIQKNYNALKLELIQSGAAEAVTRSNSPITSINSNNFVGWPGKPEDLRVIFTTIVTEYDYTKTMGIKVLEGRDFSEDFKNDTTAIIINKAGLKIMGLEDPIGTELDLWGEKRKLIGIVDDVLMASPYREVKPMFMIIDPDWISAITVRLANTGDISATLSKVKAIFKKHNPAYPFEYTFVDEEYQKKFSNINMTSKVATLFATLAIIITGLGLFGLASYTAEQRTKEIGIRKVLGATVGGLVALMSKDFSKLVIIAFVVSSPIAWWLLRQYLERYQVRVDIVWWIFPLTGLIALVFALIIIINQALRAARANPVKSLRND